MKTLMWTAAALGLFAGVASADEWRDRDQRREQARIEYQNRLERCGEHWRCRHKAEHAYHRDLARIDRHRF